jgi:hypothetical protein
MSIRGVCGVGRPDWHAAGSGVVEIMVWLAVGEGLEVTSIDGDLKSSL